MSMPSAEVLAGFLRAHGLQLNAQQQAAVGAVEGAVLLLAVPGSGKTTVLVTRLGYLVQCCNVRPEEILTMTRYMLRFMEDHGVKALLVACNTISCLIDQYRDEMSCPVLSVVQAGADAVAQLPAHKVGVISTCFTASTHCYPDLIGKVAPDKQVISHGCPNLANLVERNVGNPAGQAAIDDDLRENLEQLVNEEKVECCVLGCTHYPLVEENINRLYPQLKLVDPAEQMARTVGRYLEEKGLVNDQPGQGKLDIFTTGSTEEYTMKAAKVGLDPVTSVQFYPPMKL